MKKIIALLAVVIAFVLGNRFQEAMSEAHYRALMREALQQDLAENRAPMQKACKEWSMDFSLNEKGESVCHGVPALDGEKYEDMLAAIDLNSVCYREDGLMTVEKTVSTDGQLQVRCERTRFSDRWMASAR